MSQPHNKSETYEAFVEKFKEKHTTDDCYTPKEVYECVEEWARERYGFTGPVVRPFWPGMDYQEFPYGKDETVLDNPPFSILAKIVDYYMAKGVRFCLFAQGLTAAHATKLQEGTTIVLTGRSVKYANGAEVSFALVTNLSPDVRIELSKELSDRIHRVQKGKPPLNQLKYAPGVTNCAKLGTLSKRVEWKIAEAEPWKTSLDGKHIFGGGG